MGSSASKSKKVNESKKPIQENGIKATEAKRDSMKANRRASKSKTPEVDHMMAEMMKQSRSATEVENVKNTYSINMKVPELKNPLGPSQIDCPRGTSQGKWPIRNYLKLEPAINVNAGPGGRAGLLLGSNTYGGPGEDTTASLDFFCCGVNGSHLSCLHVMGSHSGHFGPDYKYTVNEDAELLPDLMFGTNHLAVITNDCRIGHGGFGFYIEGSNATGEATLPVCSNGEYNQDAGTGSGLTLILCSGWEDSQLVSASYIIRLGRKDNFIDKRLIHGDDKWHWSINGESLVKVSGPANSSYGGFHNRNNLTETSLTKARTYFTSTVDGEEATLLIKDMPNSGLLYIICSNSQGSEGNVGAAVYSVTINEKELTTHLLKGKAMNAYTKDVEGLWNFEINNNNLMVTGPKGPCRYSFISNLPEIFEVCQRCQQTRCLYTGNSDQLGGAVAVDDKGVTGWTTKRTDILIKLNGVARFTLSSAELIRADGKFAFHIDWPSDDRQVGLHQVQVLAVLQKANDEPAEVELEGSPSQFVIQPAGVIFAYNCCGPTYQAVNGIVYLSEHRHYVNYSYDYNWGSRHTCLGGAKHVAQIPQLITGTYDGFMYVTERSTGVEPVDEQKIKYEFENLKKGRYTLRLHFIPRSVGRITINDTNVSEMLRELIDDTRDISEGLHAHTVEIPVELSKGKLTISMTNHRISAFTLLDAKTYKEKKKTQNEINFEADRKQKLADSAEPLSRTMSRKERKIVGWSPNLLVNGSGETGSMSGWNCSGDWAVQEGGHGTEKTFVTSFMECWKEQVVNLADHFTAEYLDTQPHVQVNEWYREGCCGGGYYEFKAALLDEDEQEIDSYHFPRTGRIYRNNTWEQVGQTFKNYGAGVRKVRLASMGQDDKYWGGHFGVMMSNAIVRVAKETMPPDDDAFVDIFEESDRNTKDRTTAREKLVAKILLTHQDLLDELMHDEVIPDIDEDEARTRHRVRQRTKRKKREVRVFVSSTFRDFKPEREQLIKKTFREINKLCADRGVFFTYVDLRWGITEEQTNHGQTIAICLQEIDRCRPYFLCMMGERFGWAQQEDKPDDLLNQSFDYAIDNFPELGWLDRYRLNTSVTQLEILHGVLNDVEERKNRSFFYLRNPARQEDYSAQEFKVMQAENDWSAEQQKKLRTRVKETAGLHVRTYTIPEQVCERIKQDLEWCIEQDFPRGTELTALEREREAHVAFAEARRRVYIGREEYFDEIDKHMCKYTGVPLIILGESGSGKSALVANWAGRLEEKEADTFFFVHFIGSSAESASYTKLLRRLFEEMKLYFGIELAIPSSDSNLLRDFPTWLKMVGSQAKCVIVLDALNQMDDGSGTEGPEHDLQWIPKELPEGIYMLLSTLPGRALEAVKARDWPVMQVSPLKVNEKEQIITGYFEKIYGKTLNQEQKAMLVDPPQTNNPLYLKALLDEIRMFGNFRQLSEKIKEYLTASNPGDLFAKILGRLEEDFEHGENSRAEIVKHTTTAIWCSQRGMSESELLELLDVPSAVWSPFYLSLVENLVNRNGIVNFFHDHLRQAVESKYHPTDSDKKSGYLWLANYFSERDIDDRVAEELPFLLSKAGQLDRLRSTITKTEIFKRLVRNEDGRFELIKAWKLLGGFEEVEAAYTDVMNSMAEEELALPSNLQLQQDLAEFFIELGLYPAAQSMLLKLQKPLEAKHIASHGAIIYDPFTHAHTYRCQHPALLDLLHKLGTVCERQKKFDEGIQHYQDSISRQTRIITPDQKLQLTEGLLGQATILYLKNDMKEAKKFLVRAREVATEVLGPRHHYVAAIVNKLGQLSYKQGRVDEAFGYFLQDLMLTRGEVGLTHPRTAAILNDVALVYDDRNDPLAGNIYEAALSILLDTYGNNHLDVAVVRYNLGAFYLANDSKQRAKFQFDSAHKIYQAFLGDDHPDTMEAAKSLAEC